MSVTVETLTVALLFLAETVGVVVWATRLEGRVNLLQRWVDSHQHTMERLTRLEERVSGVRMVVDEIKDLVSKMRNNP